jgi:hypothetical protein
LCGSYPQLIAKLPAFAIQLCDNNSLIAPEPLHFAPADLFNRN